jgi:hypothetical protein
MLCIDPIVFVLLTVLLASLWFATCAGVVWLFLQDRAEDWLRTKMKGIIQTFSIDPFTLEEHSFHDEVEAMYRTERAKLRREKKAKLKAKLKNDIKLEITQSK